MPVFLKRELTDQIPSLKKQNLRHEQYATRSIQDLFQEEDMEKAMTRLYNYNSTVIAINDGNGKFTWKELPWQVQLAPVNAIACQDINADGLTDIIMGGNNIYLQPQFGRLDASYGQVLLNEGKGNFRWILPAVSGLDLPGVVRQLLPITFGNKRALLFLRNNDKPVLVQYQGATQKGNQ